MLAMDTNKLVIRLEKLMTSLPHDPVKRRHHEQSIVPWLPEDVVKLCPNCAKSFNLTRRKHHCRLCGSIMCHDCSTYVDFTLAKRLVDPAVLAAGSAGFAADSAGFAANPAAKSKKSPSIDGLVSNLADLTGLAESHQRFRSCTFCLETLLKREARLTLNTEQTEIVAYYRKLRQLMATGHKMSVEYQETAASLNAGESATSHRLEEAKVLRIRLLKMAESVDSVSRKIASLSPDEDMDPVSLGSFATLKSRIRLASVNFVKETLVGLPGIPTLDELTRLQETRKLEAVKRVEEEKRSAELAKIKYEQRQPNQHSNPVAQRKKPVKFDGGFVSTLSGSNYISSDDPIVQQMCNLREFIGQARSAGRHDDARLLEENLRDLQEEYQRQRKQLEENYESYKHMFSSANDEDGDEGNNPFDDATEEELQALESTLKASEKSAKRPEQTEEELEQHRIIDGSEDFDDYDKSGKNPFF